MILPPRRARRVPGPAAQPGAWAAERHRRREEDGAALVEFAIILPIFAAMLFAMVQFGMAFTGWDQFRNRVQTEARLLSMNALGCNSLVTCTIAISAGVGTPVGTTGQATVAISFPTDQEVNVTASIQAEPLTNFFGTITLSTVSSFYVAPGTLPWRA